MKSLQVLLGIILCSFFFNNTILSATFLTDTLKGNKNIVKIEVALGGIQFEHRLSKKSSVQMSVIYDYSGIFNSDYKDFELIPEYRFYLSKKEWPKGLFIGSFAYFKNYVVARDMEYFGSMVYSKDLVKTSGIGLKFGYQWLLTNKISTDISMGFGYNIYCDVEHKEGVIIIDENSHWLSFSGMISFGYLF